MKKFFVFFLILFALFYILSEFIGDRIIKGALENNLSNVLDRDINIETLKINYLNGDAEIKGLKIKNKEFEGNLLLLNKAYLKLNTSSIFSNNVEIESVLLDGINLNYYFNIKYTLVSDNVRSLEKTLKNGGSKSTSNKYFNINKLNAKNITLNVISKELEINKSISLQNLEFENIGNTPNSNNYKTVLRDFAEQTIKTVKKKVLSGNLQNKLMNIDEDKIKEKIKEELNKNKNKLKNKLKKLIK